jgi:hypothetical protein
VTAGNLAITARVLLEYDGFCWVTLTLAPVQGSVTLDALALEQFFTPEFSDVVNAGEYSLVGTGKIPTQPMIKGSARPIWVGNGDGGLQTFLETTARFHLRDVNTIWQLRSSAEGASLKLNMVDKPLALSAPYTIEFGFNATPVRPRAWRTSRDQWLGRRNSYFAWYTTAEDWWTGDPGWANEHWNGPMIIPQFDFDATWFRYQPYMNTDAVAINDVGAADFIDEWLMTPTDRWRENLGMPGKWASLTYHARSYRQWLMWRMHELFKKSPYVGVYYDVVSPVASANPYAEAGILKEDGARLATTSLLGLREVAKRMYVMCRKYYPDGTIMWHDSGSPHMAYMAFGEIFYDGENLNSLINASRPTYRGLLTPAMFRAEYMGHNFGPVVWWLGQGRIAKETMKQYGADVLEDHLAGLMLLHQTPIFFGGGFSTWHDSKAARRVHDAIRRYSLYGAGYRFIPYWHNPPVEGLRENQYASFYVRETVAINPAYWPMFPREETDETLPHRVAGIFCNESDWKGEMVVQVDLKKLGFADGAKVKAINAVHSTGFRVDNVGAPEEKAVYFPKPEETATLTGQELRFPMSEWNFRMIVLEEEK